MKFKAYKDIDGGIEMISKENAFNDIRDLGHMFAVSLAERGHDTQESDLMSGLAAYTLLNLKGENPRCDAAYDFVISIITDEMFKRVKGAE